MAEARRAARRWRERTVMPLAEHILAHAALVREANVLSVSLDIHVRFQLSVRRVSPFAPPSALDAFGALGDIREDESFAQLPDAAVRVADMDACTLELWSCERLAALVSTLRRVQATGAAHANVRALFTMAPAFCAVGVVTLMHPPCTPGDQRMAQLPIRSVYLGPALGACTVEWTCLRRDAYRLRVAELSGLSFTDFDAVHLQLVLGETYTTRPVELRGGLQSVADVCLQRTVRQALSQDTLRIYLYARPTRTYLAKLEAHDESQELALGDAHAVDLALCTGREASSAARIHERHKRHVAYHGIHAAVQLRDVAPDGTQHPATRCATPTGVWTLRPSARHVVSVTLRHDAGEQLPWTHIARVRIGDIRSIDQHGLTSACESELVTLQRVAVAPVPDDALCVDAMWTPSLRTAGPTLCTYLRAALLVDISIEGCIRPLTLHIPLHMRVARGTPRPAASNVEDVLFHVLLIPRPITSVQELWRADTRDVQVPGAGLLGSWQPRGLSLVRDYFAEVLCEAHVEDTGQWPSITQTTSAKALHQTNPRCFDSFSDLRSHWRALRHNDSTYYTARAKVSEAPCTQRGWLRIQTNALDAHWERRWCELHGYVRATS